MQESIIHRFNLTDKVAIITGTTRGIGQSLAKGLMEAGAKVIALDRSDNDYLKNYSLTIEADFERIIIDLLTTTEKALAEILTFIKEKYMHIDILVNNAGISRRDEVEIFDEKDWNDVMKMNLQIPFYLSKIVSGYFIKQKSGKIINIASMLSFQGGLRVPSYTSSKHAIVGLTKSYANGLAPYGINVNAIAPGFMATSLTLPLQQDKKRNEEIINRIPNGRWGQPDDLKGALIFLASSMSDYINGIIIPVDGGYLSR